MVVIVITKFKTTTFPAQAIHSLRSLRADYRSGTLFNEIDGSLGDNKIKILAMAENIAIHNYHHKVVIISKSISSIINHTLSIYTKC